jgi:hypothetical protein
MIATSFDFTVTSTRVVGFTVPLSIKPGSKCQFNVTITHDGVMLGMLWFVKIVPTNRVITFTVGPSIPLGTHHFTVLITTLTAAAIMGTTGAGAPSAADAEFASDEPAKALDAASSEESNRPGQGKIPEDAANPA